MSCNKLNYYLAAALIIFWPFQSLFANILIGRINEQAAFWLAHWYEPVIVILLLALVFKINWRQFLSRKIVMIALLLILFGIISAMFLSPSLSQGLQGFRFTLFFLLFFVWTISTEFDQAAGQRLINLYLKVATIVALWALIERFLPYHYFELWRIIANGNSFGYGNFFIVKVYQSASVLGGPNQLATYLLPAFFLICAKLFKRSVGSVWPTLGQLIILAGAIFFSFSRSGILGLFAGLVIVGLVYGKSFWQKILPLLLIGVFILLSLSFFSNSGQRLADFFTHGQSQTQHSAALDNSWDELRSRLDQPAKLLFGSGIGSAGPLVLKYHDGLVPESWYLQLLFEIGAIGLALWLLLIYYLSVELNRSNDYGPFLFIGLLAASVAALFLHTWADNPALSLSFFTLAGIVISQKESDETNIN